jgi:LysR family transcriptional regulator, hypochlorite-specific transcription factor HypT
VELKWLEDFLALVAHGTFRRAADTRHVTQPAFSRRIRSLEAWVGATLVDRSAYPLRLTRAGQIFHERALDLLRNAHELRESSTSELRATGAVRVAMPHSVAMGWLPPWLGAAPAAIRALPLGLFAANTLDAVLALEEGQADLLITYHHPQRPLMLDPHRFERLALPVDALLPYSAARANKRALYTLAGARQSPIPVASFTEGSYLGGVSRSLVAGLVDTGRITVQYQSDLAETLKSLVLQGLAVAWLPGCAVRNEVTRGALVVAGQAEHSLTLDMLALRRRESGSSALNAIWAALRETTTPPG